MLNIKDVYTLVAGLGFPIVVAVWLLVRTDALLRQNERAILKLAVAIERLTEQVRFMAKRE